LNSRLRFFLSERAATLAAALLLATGAARAQEPEYFEPPAPRPHFTFDWDFLARYDSITHLRIRPDIEHGRFELRPEVGFETSDRFRLGVRAVGTLGTDGNEENPRNFDNYRSRGVSLDRYYLEAKPGRWTIRAGRFGLPLAATEMIWDRDIQTPGVGVSYELGNPADSSVTLSAAGFRGPQRDGDRSRIGVGQVLWRRGDESRFALEAATSYWHIDPEDLKPHTIRQNHSVLDDGARRHLSRFRIADLLLRLHFAPGGTRVVLGLDGVRNFGARAEASADRDAFEGSLTVGRVGTPGDWRFFYIYQYVERDAVIGAYNTDDWWFHSRYRGHRAGVAFTLLPRTFVQATGVLQRRLDLSTTLNRVMFELVKLF